MWNCSTKNRFTIILNIRAWKKYLWARHHPGSLWARYRVYLWSATVHEQWCNNCKLMGITTYIVYCSGQFFKKASTIFLWLTAVRPALGPQKTTKWMRNKYRLITIFAVWLMCVLLTIYLSQEQTSHLLATNLDDYPSCRFLCPSNLQEKLKRNISSCS